MLPTWPGPIARRNTRTVSPVTMSQTRTVLSVDAVTAYFPSGVRAILPMLELCPPASSSRYGVSVTASDLPTAVTSTTNASSADPLATITGDVEAGLSTSHVSQTRHASAP